MKHNIPSIQFAASALLFCSAAMPATATADVPADPQAIMSGVPSTNAVISDFIIENNGGNEEWTLKNMPAWSVGNAEEFKYFHLESAYIEDWSSSHDDWLFIPVAIPAGNQRLDLDFEILTSADSGNGFDITVSFGDSANPESMSQNFLEEKDCKSPGYLWFNKRILTGSVTVGGGHDGYIGFHVKGQLRRDDWINILSINLNATNAGGEASAGDLTDNSGITVTSASGTLIISGHSGETVSVFTTDGQLVDRFTASSTHEIQLPKGIYIVKTPRQSIKAVI
ncbi:MAG: T9SS type A sorting domain-containing protein [Paramuribaculum sp.]|nr:T9SS type A sorting domain-containing protein [Paramuribaculum sp.]